jgi:RsmE family RNA methyltransferase
MNLILFTKTELLIPAAAAAESQTADTAESRAASSAVSRIGKNAVDAFLPRRDDRAAHLLKVLHKKAGDTFDSGCLGGKLGTGTITEITGDGLRVTLTFDTDPPPRTPLRLGVGFPRPIQLRRLLRDCASLGLAAVDLIGTDLGEKSYRDTKLLDDGGARSALIEGALQARDTRLPELAVFSNLGAWLDKTAPAPCANAVPAGTARVKAILLAADNVRPQGSFAGLEPLRPEAGAVLAVGSERGWSDREREQLENAGFVRLGLGKRALRTETACTAAAVLVMEKMGLLE